jgi:hypothetical protein
MFIVARAGHLSQRRYGLDILSSIPNDPFAYFDGCETSAPFR